MKKTIFVISTGFIGAGKSTLLDQMTTKVAKEADLIVVDASEMDSKVIKDRLKMFEDLDTFKKKNAPKSKPFVLERHNLEPLPEPIRFDEQNPWPQKRGKRGQKQWNTSKHNKKL